MRLRSFVGLIILASAGCQGGADDPSVRLESLHAATVVAREPGVVLVPVDLGISGRSIMAGSKVVVVVDTGEPAPDRLVLVLARTADTRRIEEAKSDVSVMIPRDCLRAAH